MSVEARNVSFSYGEGEVLRGVSFSAGPGDLVAVLGPNGVGKSTLFGCLLGVLHPQKGVVLLNGHDAAKLSGAEIAREIAYIPQSVSVTYNYTVLDTVLMGATHQIGLFAAPKQEQTDKAMAALESLGIGHLAQRGVAKISGGERQLTLLARALVQDARVLLMDEPTANLDYGNAFRVMQRIRALGAQGYTVIFSTHEPNHALRYASRVLALSGGSVLADGAPETVLTEKLLTALYGVGVAVRGVCVEENELRVSIPFERKEGAR